MLEEIKNYLSYCEYELILFMEKSGVWVNDGHELPKPPDGFKEGAGTVDLGLCLYWIHNKDLIDTSSLNVVERGTFNAVMDLLDYGLPNTEMTETNYNFFESGKELIYTDGSVLSTNKWTTYDQGWFFSFLNLVKTVSIGNWFTGNDFPGTPNMSIPMRSYSRTPDKIKIALIGDWGTGDETAQSIMDHVKELSPDYIIHLGDVYYSGSPAESIWHLKDDLYFNLGEEMNNLVNAWPEEYKGNRRSFTLNSNHEMYTGANGYFIDALKASHVGESVFDGQHGKSCFALTFGDWTILGLDSAYMGSASDGFMKGKLGDQQAAWIKEMGLDAEKTIVLSHHTGVEADCKEQNPLWTELNEALGADPYAWYWGHVHNGIAYNSPLKIASESFETNTYARCVGHSALPFGNASTLDIPEIAWRQKNKLSGSERLSNGFAMITLESESKEVARVTEHFYDLTDQPQPVFSKEIFSKKGTTKKKAPAAKSNKTVAKKAAPKKAAAKTVKKTPAKTSTKKTASVKAPAVLKRELDKLGHTFNDSLYTAIKKHLGAAAYAKDASLVACSDPEERKTIKNNFVIKKLGVKKSTAIDKTILDVCAAMGKSNRRKERVTFYYLLVVILKKEAVFV